MSSRHVGRVCLQSSSDHLWTLYRSWRKVLRYGARHSKLEVLERSNVRHMSVFQDFSRHVKGEIQSNPALQKSIEEIREKAGGLKNRTKETTEHLYKRVDAAREEAEARAKQATAAVREKVSEARAKVSEASVQVKESVWNFQSNITRKDTCKVSESGIKNVASSGSFGQDAAAGKGHSRFESNFSAGTSETSGSDSSKSGASRQEVFSASEFTKRFSSISSSATAVLKKLKNTRYIDVVRDGYNFLREELSSSSSRKRVEAKYSAPTTTERSDSTAIVAVVKKKSGWEKRWDDLKEKAQAHPVYKRLKGVKEHPVVTKGQEIAEDLRDRWETSDSPYVHKIQDLNESLFGETATGTALREIRRRDPGFSFPDFIFEVQENIRPVLQAYLKGDLHELRRRCSREVIDRCRAERRAYETQGIYFDNKILHISDAEVKETKLLGNAPIIIVAFQTQQIYCVRDKHGNITQGAKDDIHTVYYAWALQQVSAEEMEGELYPRWQLREMQQLGVQSII